MNACEGESDRHWSDIGGGEFAQSSLEDARRACNPLFAFEQLEERVKDVFYWLL